MTHQWIAASVALAVVVTTGTRTTPSRLPASPLHRSAAPAFDHPRHAKLFPSCVSCHDGVATADAPLYPDPATCASCHDGVIQKAVVWRPPEGSRAHNLRFVHQVHARAVGERPAGRGAMPDSARSLACIACHQQVNEPWMSVRFAVTGSCLDCHGVRAPHLAAPDSACATCHLPLPRATRLAASDVAKFPRPPSHDDAEFVTSLTRGHGAQARAGSPVAASCATCHARDFCVQCHVDAPEQRTIQALAPDPRSLAIRSGMRAPSSHGASNFLVAHGGMASAAPRSCATCHTRESCLTCHAMLPRVVSASLRSTQGVAPGVRAAGAHTVRRPPPSHGESFVRDHGAAANAVMPPNGCAGCHVRDDCLECHRPAPARSAGYHAPGFLTRHPASAYARETSCADCHNTSAFCSTCHVNAGLSARRSQFRTRYHDATTFFIAGHGGAARQSLESCVSCHEERDCLTCHSATGGRRFNPHGPGFDAARLARKNPQMCSACHGTSITGR